MRPYVVGAGLIVLCSSTQAQQGPIELSQTAEAKVERLRSVCRTALKARFADDMETASIELVAANMRPNTNVIQSIDIAFVGPGEPKKNHVCHYSIEVRPDGQHVVKQMQIDMHQVDMDRSTEEALNSRHK